MRKEDVASFVVYTLMLTIALLVGLFVIRPLFTTGSAYNISMNQYLFVFLNLLGAIIFNVVLLELGHLIGGKIGKYNIISFNVLGFCFYKDDKKWRFGFRSFDGLTGEVRLSPKSADSNPKPYIWIPLMLYIVELILSLVLYTAFRDASAPLAIAAVIFLTVASMINLYNFVPFKLDSMTDGYRLTLVAKKTNIEAYNELMRVEQLQREGKTVENIRVFDEITEFTASINMLSVYELLAKEKYVEALALIEKIIDVPDQISSTTYYRLIAQKLYILIKMKPLSEVRSYYDGQVDDKNRRFISNDLSMESVRAYVLIAGLLDDSEGEVQYAMSRKDKAMKRALKSRAEVEAKLYDDAIQLVLKRHPDWSEQLKA